MNFSFGGSGRDSDERWERSNGRRRDQERQHTYQESYTISMSGSTTYYVFESSTTTYLDPSREHRRGHRSEHRRDAPHYHTEERAPRFTESHHDHHQTRYQAPGYQFREPDPEEPRHRARAEQPRRHDDGGHSHHGHYRTRYQAPGYDFHEPEAEEPRRNRARTEQPRAEQPRSERRHRAHSHSHSHRPQQPPPPPPPPRETTDHYATLGISSNATSADIKKAYMKLAMKHHPDRVSAADKSRATEKMAKINVAYEVLSDPKQKQRYDQGRR